MACCILLDISSVFFVKILFSEFWRLFLCVLDFSKFSGLFSTCFEISVWNLVYTCSRWCYTSSSSFIPIGTLWPTLQPKIGQSPLSAFMALKIIQRPQIWYTHSNCDTHSNRECLDPYWLLSCLDNFWPSGGQKHLKGGLVELPASDTWGLSFIRLRSLPLKSFLDFFLNVVPYQLESWFIHWVGWTTYWVHVSLEWDPCDLHVLSLSTVN